MVVSYGPGPILQKKIGLILIPAWIRNHIYEIADPFPNFIGHTVEVWNGQVISSHTY